MTASEYINSALDQVDTAEAVGASLIRIIPNDSPDVHEICRLLRLDGRTWAEPDGWLCLKVAVGDVVLGVNDFRTLRAAAYLAEIPPGAFAEAISEMNEDPARMEKWEALQVIRTAIKARYPKPEMGEE